MTKNGYRFLYLLSDMSEVEVETRAASYSEAAKEARKLVLAEADLRDELIARMVCCETDPEIKRTRVDVIPGPAASEAA